ncbi:hypothetical protein RvY_14225-3 [Ramazzottius varieornatus]|uniref:Uncharacterized protein n=1 Tax=Ramazzottius varieornatus TaxID=947166 RepID=A0A1D1VS96_RAMVA|nr:hypothetical protein RvY_14225-3 [Ramazzottius varieornatus]
MIVSRALLTLSYTMFLAKMIYRYIKPVLPCWKLSKSRRSQRETQRLSFTTFESEQKSDVFVYASVFVAQFIKVCRYAPRYAYCSLLRSQLGCMCAIHYGRGCAACLVPNRSIDFRSSDSHCGFAIYRCIRNISI